MNKTFLGLGVVILTIILVWCFVDKGFSKESDNDEVFKVIDIEMNKNENIVISTTNNEEVVDLSVVNTDDWQTCYNKLQGYQISYPTDWFVIVGEEGPAPLPIIAKECRDDKNLNAIEPYPSVGGGPNLFVRQLSFSEKEEFSTEEYLLKHSLVAFPSAESNITIFLEENTDENYKFLVFGEKQAWKITVGGKSRQFANAVVGTFRAIE